ncbi:MAG: hypothetical protein R3C44_11980 [Chloroflexota bacterium]
MILNNKLGALRTKPVSSSREMLNARTAVAVLLAGLALLLGVQLWQSLDWRVLHDTAIIHYGAYMIDHYGFVPYRDLFDTVLPGTYLFHLAIGRTLGFGDLAFRVVDVAMLLALLAVTWRVQRPLGVAVAWAAALVFGLVYLSYGPSMSLQRDYLGLLPISVAILTASTAGSDSRAAAGRYLLIGALFGLTTWAKPQLAIGLPIVLLLAISNHRGDRSSMQFRLLLQAGILAAVGMVLVAAVPMVWTWQQGGLPAWLEIFNEYLPLYLQMTGDFKVLSGTDAILYRFTSWQELGGLGVFLAATALGGYLALFESGLTGRNRRLVVAILALVAAYGIYPILSGQFWNYHWIPFAYFASLGTSLLLVPLAANRDWSRTRQLFVAGLFALVPALTIRPAPYFFRQLPEILAATAQGRPGG